MARVFIGVGSNLGNRRKTLDQALALLKKIPNLTLVKISPVYETDPVGGPPQGKFLNAVWEIETRLAPEVLLREMLEIESQLGRNRTVKNAPRTIDLDLLFYDDYVIKKPGLTLPHPKLHERFFVLKPFANIAPDWYHPVFKKTISRLLGEIDENNPKP